MGELTVGITLNEISQTEKGKYHMMPYDFIHMWNLESKTKE